MPRRRSSRTRPDDDEAPLIPGSDGSLGIGSLKGMQR